MYGKREMREEEEEEMEETTKKTKQKLRNLSLLFLTCYVRALLFRILCR